MDEHRMPDIEAVTTEEWNVIHALRRLREPLVHATADASHDDLETAYRRLESELLDNVGATLDRMIDRAGRTSCDLDVLLQRLSGPAGVQRPAA